MPNKMYKQKHLNIIYFKKKNKPNNKEHFKCRTIGAILNNNKNLTSTSITLEWNVNRLNKFDMMKYINYKIHLNVQLTSTTRCGWNWNLEMDE